MLKRINISELRRICQGPRKDFDTLHAKLICRPVSIYVTILFLKLGLSANFVTGVFLFTGILGSILLSIPSRPALFIGALLFQLWYVLDHVDGEVARYRNQSSMTGLFFDHVSHYIVHPLFFFCLGLGLFFRTSNISEVITGYIAGLSIVLIWVIDDSYKIIASKASTGLTNSLPAQPNTLGFLRKAFSFLYHLCMFPVIIDLFMLMAIIDILFRQNMALYFLRFYAVFLLVIWSLKFSYYILTGKPDAGV